MYTAVKGKYENGILTLLGPVPDIAESEVIVTFLSEEKSNEPLPNRVPGGLLRLEHLKGKKLSLPDDFDEPLDDLKDYM